MMQPFSQSISQIAGALARAQAELQNPEKSLTAHHRLAPSRGKKAAASAMRHWRAGWRSCASA
jgi:hypothetical protein